MIWFWFACTSSPPLVANEGDPFHEGNPSIESVDMECDREKEKWTFEVKTKNWTGGGTIWMANTVDIAEKHRIKSKKAAADGSSDKLELQLSIEADWKDADLDKSTRWLCADQPRLTFLATTYDPSGNNVTDCRTWGVNTTIWEQIENAVSCDNVISFPIDTGNVPTDTGNVPTDTGNTVNDTTDGDTGDGDTGEVTTP